MARKHESRQNRAKYLQKWRYCIIAPFKVARNTLN